jgi:hypothetical protein
MEISATEQGDVTAKDKRSPSRDREATGRDRESYWSRLIPRSAPQIVLLGLAVLVISLHLKYLLEVSTVVPHLDDWNLLEKMFRALDFHRVPAWIFDSTNGHFLVPAALGYLVSWRYLGLDLTPLKLLNFPICLVAFFLTAHVINSEVKSRFLRFYLYAGASFIIFSLCFWEHFALASGFAAILSVLFGGIGLYHIAKATQFLGGWKRNLLFGLIFLVASVLSLGAGYAAVAATILLLGLCALQKFMASRPMPGYHKAIYPLAWALGLLVIISHPFFRLRSRLTQAVFHSVLVMGSSASSFLDRNTQLAQNVAFICGVVLFIASLWIGSHFLRRQTGANRRLSTFSFGLILFAVFGCFAVAIGRAYLPTGEFLNSRYTLYPSICVLGALLYFACSKHFLLINMWWLAATAYLLSTVREHQVGFYRPQVYRAMEVAINTPENLSDDQLRAALRWRENTKGVRKVAARLRKDRLNVFRDNQNNIPH